MNNVSHEEGRYDFIVVGAGAAGSVLAAELSASGAQVKGEPFPRPRELYRYVTLSEYHPRPLWALPYPLASNSVLSWLPSLHPPVSTSTYSEALDADIYAEAIRFDQDWRKREPQLLPMERDIRPSISLP